MYISLPGYFVVIEFRMAYITVSKPHIVWKPKVPLDVKIDEKLQHYVSPLSGIPVRGVIKGKTNMARWEKGDLHFWPGHRTIPVVMMDSNGKGFRRPENSIFMIKHGAKAQDIRKLVEDELPYIQAKLPLPVRLVVAVGGNNLVASQVRVWWSAQQLTDQVTSELENINQWCDARRIKVTFATVLPRPLEQDQHVGKNSEEMRILLAEAFVKTNSWIENRNVGNGSPLLPFARYVEYADRKMNQRKSLRTAPTVYQRLYPNTNQRRIRLNFFSSDGVHLNQKGAHLVEKCLHKNLEEVL